MLQHHHPHPTPDQHWDIEISDDFSARKTGSVKDVQWSTKQIGMTLGGGVTGAQQPCDGALNQHVRRKYGMLESNKLIHQMKHGINLPTTDEAGSLDILNQIWNTDDQLHMDAAKGFKQAGLSIDLNGNEDFELTKDCLLYTSPSPRDRG